MSGGSAGPAVSRLGCPGRAVVVPPQSHGLVSAVACPQADAPLATVAALPRPRNMGVSPLAYP
jgi:hypothetical protein